MLSGVFTVIVIRLDRHEGIGRRNRRVFPGSMWCSNSSHCDSNAETYEMLRETFSVRYCLGCITTSANNCCCL